MAKRIYCFAWMNRTELEACAVKARVNPQSPRLKLVHDLEKKGWYRADITDLNHIHLQRKPE